MWDHNFKYYYMDLEETIEKIMSHKKAGYNVDAMYADFKERYPKLYKMITDETCDAGMLRRFVKMGKEYTRDPSKREALDVKFGKIAADRYLQNVEGHS